MCNAMGKCNNKINIFFEEVFNYVVEVTTNTFENIKHIDESGNEFWTARELQQVLGYKEWRYFSAVIEKAQITCSQSNNNINHHFGVNTKIVFAGTTTKPIIDYKLSRYACYLIVQNANPKYKTVSLGQTYFACSFKEKWNLLRKNIIN